MRDDRYPALTAAPRFRRWQAARRDRVREPADINQEKDPGMNATAATPATPALSEVGRYCASVLAATAIESGVDEDGIRRLFARCAEAGDGFPPECEAAVLAEHANLWATYRRVKAVMFPDPTPEEFREGVETARVIIRDGAR